MNGQTAREAMRLEVQPYKSPRKIWTFDHEHNQTKGEGLLNGTELVIDEYFRNLAGRDPIPGDQMRFILDTEPFAEATTVLIRTGGDENGTTYIDQMTGMPVWLCPWLQGYFGYVPDFIYIAPSL